MPEPRITLTFTVAEWRLIAAACIRVKESALLNGKEAIPRLRTIATQITIETGKHA